MVETPTRRATVAQRWHAYWFAPEPAWHLGLPRVLFFGLLAAYYADADFSVYGRVPSAYWQPTFFFRHLPIPVFGPDTLAALGWVWKAALLLSCVGLLTRVSTAVVLLLGFYLLGLPHNFAKVDHSDAVLIFVFGILAVSRCGDALSLDRWLRRRLGRPDRALLPSGEYRWPIRAVWLLMAVVFLAAGVAKLKRSGLDWALSDNMANTLVQRHYVGYPALDWGLWIARHPLLCYAMGLLTLVAETGAPLALVSRWARRTIIPALFIMQVGNDLLLGVAFWQFMTAYVFWVNWPWLLAKLRLTAPFRPAHPALQPA